MVRQIYTIYSSLGRARWWSRRVYVSYVLGYGTWPKNIKRKTWKSSSTSSTEENFSPDDKRIKHNVSFTDSERSSESDEVLTLLNMAETVMPKLDQVLEKLQKLEDQIQSVDEKVSSLQVKVESFEVFKKETETKIKELEDGLNFANAERESFKKIFKKYRVNFTFSKTRNCIWRFINGVRIFVSSELKKKKM